MIREDRFKLLTIITAALTFLGFIFLVSGTVTYSWYTEQFCYLHTDTCSCDTPPPNGTTRCRDFSFEFETQSTGAAAYKASGFPICPRREGFRCWTLSDPGAEEGLLVTSPSQNQEVILLTMGILFVMVASFIFFPPFILKLLLAPPEAQALTTQLQEESRD